MNTNDGWGGYSCGGGGGLVSWPTVHKHKSCPVPKSAGKCCGGICLGTTHHGREANACPESARGNAEQGAHGQCPDSGGGDFGTPKSCLGFALYDARFCFCLGGQHISKGQQERQHFVWACQHVSQTDPWACNATTAWSLPLLRQKIWPR